MKPTRATWFDSLLPSAMALMLLSFHCATSAQTAEASGVLKFTVDAKGQLTFSLVPASIVDIGSDKFLSFAASGSSAGSDPFSLRTYGPLLNQRYTSSAIASAKAQLALTSAISSMSGSKPVKVEQIISGTGNVAGYWIAPETPENAYFMAKGLPANWSKMDYAKLDPNVWSGTIDRPAPTVRDVDVDKVIRDQLFAKARSLACQTPPPPTPDRVVIAADIPSTAKSLSGQTGNLKISFEWTSKELCKQTQK